MFAHSTFDVGSVGNIFPILTLETTESFHQKHIHYPRAMEREVDKIIGELEKLDITRKATESDDTQFFQNTFGIPRETAEPRVIIGARLLN